MDWIGRPVNFFNNKKLKPARNYNYPYPSKMFRDRDRDGVPDVFDCKPLDPKRQGLLDAIVGAVKGIGKGGVKAGWKEGMAKGREYVTEVNPEKKALYDTAQARKKLIAKNMYGDTMERWKSKLNYLNPRGLHKVEVPIYETDPETGRKKIVGYRPGIATSRERGTDVISKAERAASSRWNRMFTALKRSNPKYSMAMEQRGRKIESLKRHIASLDPKANAREISRRTRQLENAQRIQEAQGFRLKQFARGQMTKSGIKAVTEMFPQVYAKSGSHVMGAPGQRGRPRGSLDPRYRAYGGVIGFRRAMAAQRRAYKMAMSQQKEQLKMQQMMAQAPYEYVPQETMGQEVPQQQVAQIPQQFQQIQPQYPPEPQKRPIATVFKGSGGSPYPPVDTRPLESARQTVSQGYVESVDSFTGRRFMKKLPPTERWSGGGY